MSDFIVTCCTMFSSYLWDDCSFLKKMRSSGSGSKGGEVGRDLEERREANCD